MDKRLDMEGIADDNCVENNATIEAAINSALLLESKQRVDGIIESYQAAKQLALHSRWNNIGRPSVSPDPREISFDRNKTFSTPDITPQHDPQLMFRRMICSEEVSKNRLISRRDVKMAMSIDEDISPRNEEEEDKKFFEHLKERITADIQNNVIKKIQIPLPKRSSILKKRKSPFSIETVNLMKKSRTQMVKKLNSDMDVDHGIFSLENKEKENASVIVEKTITTKVITENNETPLNNVLDSETDTDYFCPTPLCVKNSNDNLET